jgi:hypothetical protein
MPTGAAKISMLCRGFWSRRASSGARAIFSGVQPQQSSGMTGVFGVTGVRAALAKTSTAGREREGWWPDQSKRSDKAGGFRSVNVMERPEA